MDLGLARRCEKLDLVTPAARGEAARRCCASIPRSSRSCGCRLSGGGNLQRLRRIAERTVKADLEGAPASPRSRWSAARSRRSASRPTPRGSRRSGSRSADVTRRLAEENINLAGGSLTEGQSEYLIRATQPVHGPGGDRRRDPGLAPGRRGARSPTSPRSGAAPATARSSRALDGHEAVEISVYKEGDANTVAVARAVRHRMRPPAAPVAR